MKRNTQAILAMSICGLFLFYKYIAQLYPSLISNELIEQFKLTGVQIGVLASSYYYSYSFMQVISGVILDRFDVRLPAFIAIFFIAISIFGFISTDNFYLMCLYRAFMGVGCSFATTLYIKCAANYTSPKAFGPVSSLLATAAMLGAAVGAAPVALLFEHLGWVQGLFLISIIGMVLSVVALLGLGQPAAQSKVKLTAERASFNEIKAVVCNRNNLCLMMYSGLTFCPVVILGGLWGVPFLELKLQASQTAVASIISLMFIGVAIGSPLWALLSVKLDCQRPLMLIANALSFTFMMLILFMPLSFMQAECLFTLLGMSISCFMICFILCRAINPVIVMGFAGAFINTGEGIVGSILEPLVGVFLDALKSPQSTTFALSDYQYALLALPVCFVLSSLVLMALSTRSASKSCDLSTKECA